MKAAEIDLRRMLSFRPEEGMILLGADRMLLFRQEAFAFLRDLFYEQLDQAAARALLMQFGYRCGAGDYRTFAMAYDWDSDNDRLGCGTVLHAWEGIVHVAPVISDFNRSTGHFHFRGLWKNSYEAEVHLRNFGVDAEPVCYSLCGYGSGWCSEFMGKPMLEIELSCVGRGDEVCEWEIKPMDRWGPEADPWRAALAQSSVAEQLEEKQRVILEQERTLAAMAVPIMQVWEGVIALPVIGTVSAQRAAAMMESVLDATVRGRTRFVVLDLTGVHGMDAATAGHLVRIAAAIALLGARCLVCGISPAVAQMLVTLGTEVTLHTFATLESALRHALHTLGVTIGRPGR
jgi:anti-anti-sigma factor